jgi:hypothetical protein
VALVEDVALAVLGDEEHAGWVAEGGLAVGAEGSGQAGGEALCAVVGGEVDGGPWYRVF